MDIDFDLYITMPSSKKSELPSNLLPRTTIFFVPNHGRDILPFFYVIKRIKNSGYKSVLKLHSKKSPHFDGGTSWRDEMVGALTGENVTAINQAISEGSFLIGPKGQYMSLEVNFEANERHLRRIVEKKLPQDQVDSVLYTKRKEHGFFAGSMFWASYELLSDPVFQFPVCSYELEDAQVDGTLAHALERAVTLIAEAASRSVQESDGEELRVISFDSGLIPEWSDKYVKPN